MTAVIHHDPPMQQGLLGGMFTPLELQLLQAAHAKRQQRREASKEKAAKYHYPKFVVDDKTLDLLDGPLLEGYVIPSEGRVRISEKIELDQPDEITGIEEWTEGGIVKLHLVLLERSLELLQQAGNAREKAEILDWIYNPEVPNSIIKIEDGVRRRVYTPFAFATCCKMAGVDPDELQDQLRALSQKIGIVIQP